MNATSRTRRLGDWKNVRGSIDLAAVATELLGPPAGRRGDRGRRLWWRCPFHADKNPSFCVEGGKPFWRCFGCAQSGDAASLIMRLENVSFPEAVRILTGIGDCPSKPREPHAPSPSRPSDDRSPFEGMTPERATALVERSESRLWSSEGREALAYLRDERRLDAEVIRAARLGYAEDVRATTKDGLPYRASGIVLPWFDGDRVAFVKVRRLDGGKRRYAQVFDSATATKIFPRPEAIKRGRPLFVCEGEFDALILNHALRPWDASAITLGSASAEAKTRELDRLRIASKLIVATDADAAGERRADRWLQVCPAALRVRPPRGLKDWTDAACERIDLRRYLRDFMHLDVFGRDKIDDWRWGPCLEENDVPSSIAD